MPNSPIERFMAKWGMGLVSGLLITIAAAVSDKVYTSMSQQTITQTKLDDMGETLEKLETGQKNLYEAISTWKESTDQRLTALETHNTDQQSRNEQPIK